MLSRRQSLLGAGADFDCVGNMPRGSTNQIRVLTLNDNEHHESTLYRLQKGWRLQFRVGPSLFGKTVSLFCNHPPEADQPFDRTRYYPCGWQYDSSKRSGDDTAAFADVNVRRAGSFHYYYVYEGSVGKQGSGFFTVDPVLSYGRGEVLPLDCIQCQTVLTKSLGPLSTWEKKMRVAKESGYNMIHYTPIQELGGSNSSYSLSDQLKLNPLFDDGNKKTVIEDVEQFVAMMRVDWKMLGICDIVLNHTANESPWLQQHPESTYNCSNSPHMRPAYLVDALLHQLTVEVADDKWQYSGIPKEVNTEDHLNAIRSALLNEFLPRANIPELFMMDVASLASEFCSLARNRLPSPVADDTGKLRLVIVQDPQYRRLKSTVDMELALRIYNVYRADCFDEDTRLRRCSDEFRRKLDALNHAAYETAQGHLVAAVDNTVAGVRYFRVQPDGPRIKEVSLKDELVPRYFTTHGNPSTMEEEEELMCSENGKFLMAHNGWVMNSDPLSNFAAAGSNVYLRRELIAWGDSVKLRYGEKPEDSPFLWEHMTRYVEQTARVFDGIRLDNCHSTPIPVAEYLLDAARRVKPDLYVAAELFTNSDQTDNIFVNRLGITSLIREAMSAWDAHELGRLVHRYGGEPVGGFFQAPARPLVASIAHALFLDQTHDNPSPVDKRCVFDLLPSAALVSMACCASGSNRGYDELVPHHIHVVDETRSYAEWSDDVVANCVNVNLSSGIIAAKRALNKLHFYLGQAGFNQVYVDQVDPDIVAVTRHCVKTHETVVLLAYTAFNHPERHYRRHGVKPLRVEGKVEEVVLEASLAHKSNEGRYARHADHARHDDVINGLPEYEVKVRENLTVAESDFLEVGDSGDPNVTQLNLKDFQPGSVVAIRVSLQPVVAPAVSQLHRLLSSFIYETIPLDEELRTIISQLSLADLNRALYRCDQEERDEGGDTGAYDIPGAGPIVYCGLQGFLSLLCDIRPNNDLGHPMCNNLRQGNWMIDYVTNRLLRDPGTEKLGRWLEKSFVPLKAIPRYLVPSYFDAIVTGIYQRLLEASWDLMDDFVSCGSTFIRGLALGSVQCGAVIRSSPLPPLAAGLAPPLPPTRVNERGEVEQACLTLSAGLPHFTCGYMRNWGRDTFIAMRGLFLLTGRHQEARYHILGYAGCLRHGLLPNLLDGGRNARFNCRDAVWWWLDTIKAYVAIVPDGHKILHDKVARLFPTDDSPPITNNHKEQPLCDVIHEALSTHFQGLVFRERNAGTTIDAHMQDAGFNNQIGVHPETGFVFGGNANNCGTWMDKMGSSDKAGNRGKPSSPRDGSAVELVGLCKSALRFLAGQHEKGAFPHSAVTRTNKDGSATTWSYREWESKIAAHFESCYFVASSPQPNESRADLVHRRGVYKDTFNSSQPWTDFQLRPNFPIAMVAAPEMFDPGHAWAALKQAEQLLLGPLGMRTLDPADWSYDGDYNNADDSDNPKLAHGFNYHQGPEWVWPIGFFLRARLHFASLVGGASELRRTAADTRRILSRHFAALQSDPWRGLPELTNKDGAYCRDSCRTQAWSMGCVLEVLYDLNQLESVDGNSPSN